MTKIRTQVMASVVLIYAARQLISGVALKAYGILAAFIATASLVSIGDVVQNFLSVGFSGAGEFIVAALVHTATPVQFMSFAMVLLAALLVRDIVGTGRTRRFI